MSITQTNQWNEGDTVYKQYNLSITNNSDKPIKSLKIEASNFTIKDIWNLLLLNNNEPRILSLPTWMTDNNSFQKGVTREAGFVTSSQPTFKIIEIVN